MNKSSAEKLSNILVGLEMERVGVRRRILKQISYYRSSEKVTDKADHLNQVRKLLKSKNDLTYCIDMKRLALKDGCQIDRQHLGDGKSNVTDHAVVQYLKRYTNVDVKRLRMLISTDTNIKKQYNDKGTIITVLSTIQTAVLATERNAGMSLAEALSQLPQIEDK